MGYTGNNQLIQDQANQYERIKRRRTMNIMSVNSGMVLREASLITLIKRFCTYVSDFLEPNGWKHSDREYLLNEANELDQLILELNDNDELRQQLDEVRNLINNIPELPPTLTPEGLTSTSLTVTAVTRLTTEDKTFVREALNIWYKCCPSWCSIS